MGFLLGHSLLTLLSHSLPTLLGHSLPTLLGQSLPTLASTVFRKSVSNTDTDREFKILGFVQTFLIEIKHFYGILLLLHSLVLRLPCDVLAFVFFTYS